MIKRIDFLFPYYYFCFLIHQEVAAYAQQTDSAAP